jgi:hypothetical protein
MALKEGGVDVLWIETMSSEEELRAAVEGAAKAGLPLVTTMSFDTNGRTMMGITPKAFGALTASLGTQPVAIGANCGVGASELVATVLGISEARPDAAIVAKGNCGIPQYKEGHIHYTGTPELMADYARIALDSGAKIIGGCAAPARASASMRSSKDHKGVRPTLELIERNLGLRNSPRRRQGRRWRRPASAAGADPRRLLQWLKLPPDRRNHRRGMKQSEISCRGEASTSLSLAGARELGVMSSHSWSSASRTVLLFTSRTEPPFLRCSCAIGRADFDFSPVVCRRPLPLSCRRTAFESDVGRTVSPHSQAPRRGALDEDGFRHDLGDDRQRIDARIQHAETAGLPDPPVLMPRSRPLPCDAEMRDLLALEALLRLIDGRVNANAGSPEHPPLLLRIGFHGQQFYGRRRRLDEHASHQRLARSKPPKAACRARCNPPRLRSCGDRRCFQNTARHQSCHGG